MLTATEIKKIIAENWNTKTYKEIGLMVGLSNHAVRARGHTLKLPAKVKVNSTIDYNEIARQNPGLAAECTEHQLPINEVKHYWHKSKKFSIFSKKNIPDYFQMRSFSVV